MPLSLVVQIDLAVLELDALGGHGVTSSRREGAQVVIVEPEVVRVRFWLRLFSTWVD